MFIQVLCHHHRLADGEAQLAGCFLLQGRSSEWRRRSTLQRLLADRLYGEVCFHTLLQEFLHLLVRLHALSQRCLYLCLRTIRIGNSKNTIYAIVGLALEVLNLALTLNNQSYGNTLHTTC